MRRDSPPDPSPSDLQTQLLCETEPASFRDRQAQVFYENGRILRGLTSRSLDNWNALQNKTFFRQLLDDGELIRSRLVHDARGSDGWAAILEHERVPTISYPYEWSFSMLQDAALLQLRILKMALSEGFTLKDATPFNVQWRGATPVFIDVASLVPFREGEFWTGYRQFCEMFLNPLIIYAYKNVDFHPWLRGRIDGIPVSQCARLMSLRDLLRPGVLKHVTLHSAAQNIVKTPPMKLSSEAARSMPRTSGLVLKNLHALESLILQLNGSRESTWSRYTNDNTYTPQAGEEKERFIRQVLSEREPAGQIVDFGCNTGLFSKIAAEFSSSVIAFDVDHPSVDMLYRGVKGNRAILPLVFDLANPSPGLGWNRLERKPLEDRLSPSVVLALALIHHLVIGRNIPMTQVLDYFRSLDCTIVLEWISRSDQMVDSLLLQKDETFDDYDCDNFEKELTRHFAVERQQKISETRWLYQLRPRT